MNLQELYLESIHHKYPNFSIHSVKSNISGQNNDILIINEELIFRFPKYADGIKRLEIETAILAGIQDYITLRTPHITFAHLATQTGSQAFVGYQRIPGEPLWRKTFLAISDESTIERLAQQLAQFLKELHTVPVKTAISRQLPLYDTYHEWADIYSRIREKCFPYMKPDARDWTIHHFETFLRNRHNFEYEPILKHGDFGTANILFDQKTQVINGIIDFSSAGLGDPAYDFAGILSSYGEPFLKRFSTIYPEIESFWERILFYKGTFAMLEALFGIENNDKEAFESGIADYRS